MPDLISVRSEPWRRRLYLPAYSVVNAARYSKTTTQTVAYWHYRGGGLGPAIPGKEPRRPLSYLQLVEVAFVAIFRKLGVPLQRIRHAREYVAQMFGADYPFAQYRFKTEGFHILLDLTAIEPDPTLKKTVILADAHGQEAWEPMLADKFAEFDYDGMDIAIRWHVGGIHSGVIIDPRIGFGAPTVSGIPTWALKGRWDAGESLNDIQEDFGLPDLLVRQALEFEGVRAAEFEEVKDIV